MLFNSFAFLIFFCVVFVFYWLNKNQRFRVIFLAVASFIFYAYHRPYDLLILFYSILLNYYCAIKIESSQNKKYRKIFLWINILGNVGLLAFYKYVNFFLNTTHRFFAHSPRQAEANIFKIALPLGISFFTFQGMAYVIDVYRKEVKPEKNLINFSFFKGFFAQLIAGPIVRARAFLPQLKTEKKLTSARFQSGFYLIAWGLVKKIVIADNLAPIVSAYFSNPVDNFLTTWIAIYAFAFQIYCDFSGYCDIGIGCAKTLDYDIPVNFRQPYLSENVTVFWRNWNLTLSNWFRDYLFIPLGGSHDIALRYYFNLLATMLVAGLWHGANYTFVIWGFYHGVLLVLHKISLKFIKIRIPRVIAVLFTFHLVCLGWIFFRASSVHTSLKILKYAFHIGTANIRLIASSGITILFFILPILAMQICERKFSIKDNFVNFPRLVKFVSVAAAILLLVLFGTPGNQFIYFDF